MTRMVTTVPQKGAPRADMPQYSEEEKQAYYAKWRKFAEVYMGRRPEGGTRGFKAVVVDITEPEERPNTYPGTPPGTMGIYRDIYVELAEEGVEGLRFKTTSADNVQNEKTRLYMLYQAVHGKTPPPKYESFTYDVDALIGPFVTAVIEKGKPRADGKRGGLEANIIRFEGFYEDEASASPPARVAAQPAAQADGKAAGRTRATRPAVMTPDTEDELPF
jgi:hypothetical protein